MLCKHVLGRGFHFLDLLDHGLGEAFHSMNLLHALANLMPQPRDINRMSSAVQLHQALSKLADVDLTITVEVYHLPNVVGVEPARVQPELLQAGLSLELHHDRLELGPLHEP